MKKAQFILIVVLSMVIFLSLGPVALAGEIIISQPSPYTVVQLTNNSYADSDAHINASGQVVWKGYTGSNSEIFMYSGGVTTQLTDDNSEDRNPEINDLGQVVWEHYNSAKQAWEIYLYSGGATRKISINFSSNGCDQLDPVINDIGDVAWHGRDCGPDNDYEIFFYDDGVGLTQVTHNNYNDGEAPMPGLDGVRINHRGKQLVWQGQAENADWEIFRWSQWSPTPIQRLTENSRDDQYPDINRNGYAVWQNDTSPDPAASIPQIIYNESGDNTNNHPLPCSGSGGCRYPRINDNGLVTWDHYDGLDYEIYRYSGWPGGDTTQLSSNSAYNDRLPQINLAGDVAWMREPSSSGGEGDYEIYAYTGGNRIRLSNNTFDDINPQMRDYGVVVWYSNNGDNSEIYLATQGPWVTVPDDIIAEATGPTGANVTFTATATDGVDGSITPDCMTLSGTRFAIGTRSVSCRAEDSNGNSNTRIFTVTVVDTKAPVVGVPGNITTEATGPDGAAVSFSASASDIVDGAITPTCAPASGSTFPLGSTTVTCSAMDSHGNTGSASFTVTVVDTTAPVVGVPGNITTEATGPDGAAVSFSASASDIVDGAITPTCAPASGSTFPLGSTTVICSAMDSHSNTGSASFTVTVEDTTAPLIIYTGPFGTVDISNPDVTAQVTDAVGATTEVSIDGGPATACTDDGEGNVSCATSGLANGVHSVLFIAWDAAGNLGTLSVPAAFEVNVCTSGKPTLGLSKKDAYWAGYPDFLAGVVTVPAVFSNNGADTAYDVTMTGATCTNGVLLVSPMPLNIGDIVSGASAEIGVRYHVPAGVGSFHLSITGTATDACGTIYDYPGPGPYPAA